MMNGKSFKLATINDYDEIQSLFKVVISHMNRQNIDQWDDIYPNESSIRGDIEKKQMHLLFVEHKIAAVIVLNEEQDESYQTGDWSCIDGKTAVIHRLCVHPDFQNMGLGKDMIRYSENLLVHAGYSAIRLDAFLLNPMAIRLYENMGYSQKGTVKFRKGEFGLFEKQLTV